MKVVYKDKQYELMANLRVAYTLQNKNNHEPYTKILSSLRAMPLEKQIEVIYTSFALKNPEEAKQITEALFLDYALDNYKLSDIMDSINFIMEGILGKELIEEARAAQVTEAAEEKDSGNV